MPTPSIKVTRLAHVGLRARDLGSQAAFYTDRWGLEAIDEHGKDVFLRAEGPDHHVLTLHAGDEAGMDHFALEVDDPDDLDRAADLVSAQGLEIVSLSFEEGAQHPFDVLGIGHVAAQVDEHVAQLLDEFPEVASKLEEIALHGP